MTKEAHLISELFDTVATVRDEIRVQANLARKDATDELHELEEKWKDVQKERKRVTDVLEHTAAESMAGVRLILEELRDGYGNLRARKP